MLVRWTGSQTRDSMRRRQPMILFASVIVLAFVLGFAFGGRLSRFEGVGVRWWALALGGLAVQFIPLPEGAGGTDLAVRTVVLAASYVALIGFAAVNARLPGIPVILVGLVLNAIVITTNGGMPVSAAALRSSDQADVLADLQGSGADKHHLETDGDVVTFLGDVIAIPSPIAQVVSIGDVLVYLGLIWFVVAAMRGRIQPASAPPADYRGRHRPEEEPPALERHAPQPPSSPGATTSGSEP
jgi:Family of unknown function (DUF5317)